MADMRIEYSGKDRRRTFPYTIRRILKFILFLAFFICPVVNYFTGTPWWSAVADFAIVFFWIEFLSRDVLENNTVNQVFRIGSFAIIETTLIGLLISPGWLSFVLPIIGFSTLILSGVFFLINLDRHRNSIMPLILELIIAMAAFIAVYFTTKHLNWPMITLGGLAFLMSASGIFVFHKDIWTELKKRFHTK